MASYRATAAKVAESKRQHPDQFCPADRCLWRTGGGRCPRHGGAPAIGTRFLGGEGKFTWTMEYVGQNPAPMYESQDAHLVRVVETCAGGPAVGTESAVEAKWFETHRRAGGTTPTPGGAK